MFVFSPGGGGGEHINLNVACGEGNLFISFPSNVKNNRNNKLTEL